jgi:hypothetical protein
MSWRGLVRGHQLRRIALAALAISTVFAADSAVVGANVIYDPNFGHGLHGWRTVVIAHGTTPGYPHVSVLRTPPEALLKCERRQRHHSYLQMDVPTAANAYVEQSIIVPASPGRLRFRTWGDLEPVKASISIVNGTVAHRLLSFTPPLLRATPTTCSHRKPLTVSLNVARWAGQAVGVRIQASARAAAGTIADFDSFELSGR